MWASCCSAATASLVLSLPNDFKMFRLALETLRQEQSLKGTHVMRISTLAIAAALAAATAFGATTAAYAGDDSKREAAEAAKEKAEWAAFAKRMSGDDATEHKARKHHAERKDDAR
jgi:hypothetical protein